MREPLLERAIGVVYRPDTERWSHYFEARVARQFDAVVHLDTERGAAPLEVSGDSNGRRAGGFLYVSVRPVNASPQPALRLVADASLRRAGRPGYAWSRRVAPADRNAAMLIDFFYTLRGAKLPVSVKEYLTLLEAMKAGVIDDETARRSTTSTTSRAPRW